MPTRSTGRGKADPSVPVVAVSGDYDFSILDCRISGRRTI